MNPFRPFEKTYYTTTTNRLDHANFSPQPRDPPFVHYAEDPVLQNEQCFHNLYTKNCPSVRLEPFHPVALTSTRLKEKYSSFRSKIKNINAQMNEKYFENAEIDDELIHEICDNYANRTVYLITHCKPGEEIITPKTIRRAILSGKDKLIVPNPDWTDPNNSQMKASYRNPLDVAKVGTISKTRNFAPTGLEDNPIVTHILRKNLNQKDTVYQKDICDTERMAEFKKNPAAIRPIDRYTKIGKMI